MTTMPRSWKLYHIHLQDEIPGVGSGQRLVEAQVGRKWVFVRRHYGLGAPSAGKARRKHKVSVALWNTIKPTPAQPGDSPK